MCFAYLRKFKICRIFQIYLIRKPFCTKYPGQLDLSPVLIWTGGSTPLLCLEVVPDLLVAPQDEAVLTKTFQTWPRGWFHILFSNQLTIIHEPLKSHHAYKPLQCVPIVYRLACSQLLIDDIITLKPLKDFSALKKHTTHQSQVLDT